MRDFWETFERQRQRQRQRERQRERQTQRQRQRQKSDLDSIRNSCDVFFLNIFFPISHLFFLVIVEMLSRYAHF